MAVNTNDTTLYTLWELEASGDAGLIQLAPGGNPADNEWIRVIPPNGTTHSLGFCANRNTPFSGSIAEVVDTSGTF